MSRKVIPFRRKIPAGCKRYIVEVTTMAGGRRVFKDVTIDVPASLQDAIRLFGRHYVYQAFLSYEMSTRTSAERRKIRKAK